MPLMEGKNNDNRYSLPSIYGEDTYDRMRNLRVTIKRKSRWLDIFSQPFKELSELDISPTIQEQAIAMAKPLNSRFGPADNCTCALCSLEFVSEEMTDPELCGQSRSPVTSEEGFLGVKSILYKDANLSELNDSDIMSHQSYLPVDCADKINRKTGLTELTCEQILQFHQIDRKDRSRLHKRPLQASQPEEEANVLTRDRTISVGASSYTIDNCAVMGVSSCLGVDGAVVNADNRVETEKEDSRMVKADCENIQTVDEVEREEEDVANGTSTDGPHLPIDLENTPAKSEKSVEEIHLNSTLTPNKTKRHARKMVLKLHKLSKKDINEYKNSLKRITSVPDKILKHCDVSPCGAMSYVKHKSDVLKTGAQVTKSRHLVQGIIKQGLKKVTYVKSSAKLARSVEKASRKLGIQSHAKKSIVVDQIPQGTCDLLGSIFKDMNEDDSDKHLTSKTPLKRNQKPREDWNQVAGMSQVAENRQNPPNLGQSQPVSAAVTRVLSAAGNSAIGPQSSHSSPRDLAIYAVSPRHKQTVPLTSSDCPSQEKVKCAPLGFPSIPSIQFGRSHGMPYGSQEEPLPPGTESRDSQEEPLPPGTESCDSELEPLPPGTESWDSEAEPPPPGTVDSPLETMSLAPRAVCNIPKSVVKVSFPKPLSSNLVPISHPKVTEMSSTTTAGFSPSVSFVAVPWLPPKCVPVIGAIRSSQLTRSKTDMTQIPTHTYQLGINVGRAQLGHAAEPMSPIVEGLVSSEPSHPQVAKTPPCPQLDVLATEEKGDISEGEIDLYLDAALGDAVDVIASKSSNNEEKRKRALQPLDLFESEQASGVAATTSTTLPSTESNALVNSDISILYNTLQTDQQFAISGVNSREQQPPIGSEKTTKDADSCRNLPTSTRPLKNSLASEEGASKSNCTDNGSGNKKRSSDKRKASQRKKLALNPSQSGGILPPVLPKADMLGAFHGRTLLWGNVKCRKICHNPIHLEHPFKPSGKPEVVPVDPRCKDSKPTRPFCLYLPLPAFAEHISSNTQML